MPAILLETFVECDRLAGTCFRAANWTRIGETVGRGKRDRIHNRPTTSFKSRAGPEPPDRRGGLVHCGRRPARWLVQLSSLGEATAPLPLVPQGLLAPAHPRETFAVPAYCNHAGRLRPITAQAPASG